MVLIYQTLVVNEIRSLKRGGGGGQFNRFRFCKNYNKTNIGQPIKKRADGLSTILDLGLRN